MVFPFSVAMELEAIVHKILSKSEFEEIHNDPMQLISPLCASVSSFIKRGCGLEQGKYLSLHKGLFAKNKNVLTLGFPAFKMKMAYQVPM